MLANVRRSCRYVPLGQQPLVLVLCQVSFSPVRQMSEYIPAIQEAFRRHGYPVSCWKTGSLVRVGLVWLMKPSPDKSG